MAAACALGCAALTAGAQPAPIAGVPEFADYHGALSNLVAGLDAENTNMVTGALLDLHLLDQNMGPKLIHIGRRIMTAGVDVIVPGGTAEELADTPLLIFNANQRRTMSLLAAQGWTLTGDPALRTVARSSLQESTALDRRMADAVNAELPKLAGRTLPANLYVELDVDAEVPGGATVAVKSRIINAGDLTASNAVLKVEKARNARGGTEEVPLGDIPGGAERTHVSFLRAPADGAQSTYIQVSLEADNTETLTSFQALMVSTNAP